jgi:hypothetical protein
VAIWLAMTLLMLGNSTPRPAAEAGRPVLRVRALADGGIDRKILAPVRQIAERLLQDAGIATSWRLCDGSQPCEAISDAVPEITVILSSQKKPLGRQACGVAVGAGAQRGTVVVSVPCVAGWVFELSRTRSTYAQPFLAMPMHDDVVGAAVAHEIGHIFGLKHAKSGLMRATLGPGDVVDLRRGLLGFSQQEAASMRATVLSAQAARQARAARDGS